jgi:hypothetical protein
VPRLQEIKMENQNARECAVFFLELALELLREGRGGSQVRRVVRNAYVYLQDCALKAESDLERLYVTDNFEAD